MVPTLLLENHKVGDKFPFPQGEGGFVLVRCNSSSFAPNPFKPPLLRGDLKATLLCSLPEKGGLGWGGFRCYKVLNIQASTG